MRSASIRLLSSLLLSGLVLFAEEQPIVSEAVSAWADQTQAKWQQTATETTLLLPGLRADRASQQVELLAAATGVASGGPIEFFFVSPNGKDYEALSVCLARPSDVDQALRFLGLVPGRPVDASRFLFWPQGPGVQVSLSYQQADGWSEPVPIERFLYDGTSKRALPVEPLVFVGSKMHQTAYAADELGDVASTYNDPYAVLDISFRYGQAEVYNRFTTHPEQGVPTGTPLRLVLRPVPAENAPVQATLTVSANAGRPHFQLVHGEEQTDGSLQQILQWFEPLAKAGRHVHLAIAFAETLPVSLAIEVAAIVDELTKREVIRPEPATGQLYYEALLPQQQWRQREARTIAPIELHIEGHQTVTRGRFEHLEEKFEPRRQELLSWPFEGAQAIADCLAKRERWWTSNVFMFTPPDTPMGVIHALYAELAETTPVAFLFINEPPTEAVPETHDQ